MFNDEIIVKPRIHKIFELLTLLHVQLLYTHFCNAIQRCLLRFVLCTSEMD